MYKVEDDDIRERELVFYSVGNLHSTEVERVEEIIAFTMSPALDRCFECKKLPAGEIPEPFHNSARNYGCSLGIQAL